MMKKIIVPKKIITLLLVACSSILCPAQIKSNDVVKAKNFNYPVLKGKKDNPVLRIEIKGKPDKRVVHAFKVNLKKTALHDLRSVRVYYTSQDSSFNTKTPFGSSNKPTKNMVIRGQQELIGSKHYFWVSYELAEKCKLSSKVSIDVDFVQLSNKKITSIEKQGQNPLRVGVALRQHNDDQVHTYRIPGLTTTNAGTLLAVYDVRRESKRDLQGNMDIGLSRSTDSGETWEPMRIALDMKKWGGLPEKFNGVSDACILTDKNTGAIYIAGLWMHGVINSEGKWVEGLTEKSEDWNHQWRNKGSQPGFDVRQTSQFLITKSVDDGKSWSEPINITQMIKKPEWWLLAPAPGHGITLKDGTLVFPTQGRDENGRSFSNITYSKDGGKSWKTSNAAYHNTTENMAVQLSDGSIMLNMRDNRNQEDKSENNGRSIAVTSNLGEAWTEHPTSRGTLVEPTCMASIHSHNYINSKGDTTQILFFSNPNSKYKRHKQTIKMSLDDGKTWPEKYWVELDEGSGGGYSCLTSVDNKTIGILYEGSQSHMTFQQINIEDLFQNE